MIKLPIISKGIDGGMDFQRSTKRINPIPLIAVILIIFILFVILFLRFFQLTVVKGAYYKNLSEKNRIREVIVEAERGTIVDRKGFVLAKNSPANINQDVSRLESHRIYSEPEVFAHLIGYRLLASKEDLISDNCLVKLKSGDKTGKKAVEKLFECDLRGNQGRKLSEVDATGKLLRTISILEPVQGKKIQLAIDGELQKEAYDVIKDKKAVVVSLRPRTGEILVLTSSPSYNTQYFEDGSRELSAYFSDDNKPMLDRATEGLYAPGSVFKMVVATASLEEKQITKETQIKDTGKIQAGSQTFNNWYYLQYGRMDEDVDVIKALQRSNDVFFYVVGEKLGPQLIKDWAEKFGYHQKTGIGIDEFEGTIPFPFWKEDVIRDKWYTGDTYNMSIGQGYILTTPLQVARATMPFANGGYMCKPLLLKIGSDVSSEYRIYAKPDCKKMPITNENLQTIREGMISACKTGGTGWPFFNFGVHTATPSGTIKVQGSPTLSVASNSASLSPIQVGCKTGTAESKPGKQPHAWFTVFAPADNPEIVLTVFVEEGGQGSDVASPIAKNILQRYFERKE
ncbi:MAG: penicillin-binding transpeptidase domain-containing protein [Candidatus Roizmanbacteria bacterium]